MLTFVDCSHCSSCTDHITMSEGAVKTRQFMRLQVDCHMFYPFNQYWGTVAIAPALEGVYRCNQK